MYKIITTLALKVNLANIKQLSGRSPTLLKKKKCTISNKRNLWWNKNIRLANLAGTSNIWLVRFDPISSVVSLKTNIFTKLHSAVDLCVFTSQVMYYMYKQWSLYFIKVLKSPGSYDFLEQIELDHISVTISAEHDKWNCQLPWSANLCW